MLETNHLTRGSAGGYYTGVSSVLFDHIRMPAAKFWLVCSLNPKGKFVPIVMPADQCYQEYYVESDEQHEGVLNAFTTPGGADRYKARLAADGTHEDLQVKRIDVDEFLKIIHSVDSAYRFMKQRSIRVDLYDVRTPMPRREIIYSRWVPKH